MNMCKSDTANLFSPASFNKVISYFTASTVIIKLTQDYIVYFHEFILKFSWFLSWEILKWMVFKEAISFEHYFIVLCILANLLEKLECILQTKRRKSDSMEKREEENSGQKQTLNILSQKPRVSIFNNMYACMLAWSHSNFPQTLLRPWWGVDTYPDTVKLIEMYWKYPYSEDSGF